MNYMIIFLYGADSYRSKKKLEEIIDHYKKIHKSGLNLIYIDTAQTDFTDFYNSFKSSSMFAEKKLLVVKNVFSNKKFQEDLLLEIKNINSFKDIVVVYESDTVDERTKTFKTLIKECKSQEFKSLDTKELKVWAREQFEVLGQKINLDALDLVVSYVGNNLWQLSNEIKKLSDFKRGLTIKKEDVEVLVRPNNIQVDIFKTIDALAQKNKKQALLLLQKHLDSGEVPLYLLSMIAWQFKNLLVVKELAQKGMMYNSIVKKSGLHPFVVQKNYFMCNQFTLEELKGIYQKIFTIDLGIKTGSIEEETALHLLVAQI